MGKWIEGNWTGLGEILSMLWESLKNAFLLHRRGYWSMNMCQNIKLISLISINIINIKQHLLLYSSPIDVLDFGSSWIFPMFLQ